MLGAFSFRELFSFSSSSSASFSSTLCSFSFFSSSSGDLERSFPLADVLTRDEVLLLDSVPGDPEGLLGVEEGRLPSGSFSRGSDLESGGLSFFSSSPFSLERDPRGLDVTLRWMGGV